MIAERNATTVVEPGWQASVGAAGDLMLTPRAPASGRARAPGTAADPVMLEVFNNLFMSIAEQMGLRLQNTAHSVNIKERLDFSCALFDAQGELIANAPHMPVHLGSMSESIRTRDRRATRAMRPGDVYVLNDPYHGGTHLPDVTVVTPVFWATPARPQFFVASRGHHADIGGITPGLDAAVLAQHRRGGRAARQPAAGARRPLREAELRARLASGPCRRATPTRTWPTCARRSPPTRRACRNCARWSAQWGAETVAAYMRHVQDNAEEAVRRVIDGAEGRRAHVCRWTTARGSA